MILFFIIFFMLQVSFDHDHSAEKMKYLALGDSYTIGESVEYMERFPVQLTNKLRFSGFDFANPEIIAKTGWTSGELLQAIDANAPSKNFDLVTLLIGVNNQYRGREMEEYGREFEILLKKSITFAGGDKDRVIVISIPDYGVTPFGEKKGRKKIATEIDEFNRVNLEISEKYEVMYVNVTEISRKAYRRRNLVADDGLHPSGEMYGLWVEAILPAAVALLSD